MFGCFRQVLAYKCQWYGKELFLADRFYPSTQRRSRCGFVKLVLTAANKIRKGKAIFFLNNVGNRFTIPYYSIFYIADESFHVLHDINLNIEQGEFVGIMGKSGSGKFALINIIGFLDDQFEERYDFYEHPIHDYRRAQFSKCGRIKLWEII